LFLGTWDEHILPPIGKK